MERTKNSTCTGASTSAIDLTDCEAKSVLNSGSSENNATTTTTITITSHREPDTELPMSIDILDFDCEKPDFDSGCTIAEKVSLNASVSQVPSPPDGGWGWVIVFASFMCNVIVDGIIFSFGILLLEISKTFKESKGTTAWIGSLQAGCYLAVGPLVSSLANKYGCRRVTIIGSVIAAFGFLLSTCANSVLWMSITFGVVGGVGFGFIYLPAIVTVGYYFETKRAFATGIAVCGSGIGAFILAPVVQLLNEYYGWRGCIMILSGLILNCAVFGSLFRPIEIQFPSSDVKKPLLAGMKNTRDGMLAGSDDEDNDTMSPPSSENSSPPDYETVVGMLPTQRPRLSLDETHSGYSLVATRDEQDKQDGSQSSVSTEAKKFTQSLKTFFTEIDTIMYNELDKRSPVACDTSVSNYTAKHDISDLKLSSVSCIAADDTPHARSSWIQRLIGTLDISLLTSPSFLLLAFSGFLTLAGFFIPFMYIVDRAVLAGIPAENGAYLLSIIGITNTVGRVFCGWISDRPQVNALLINNIALVVGGGVTLLSPLLCNTFLMLAIYCSIFGFSIACFAALRSVITVELLGLERLTSAFGLLLLPQGIATIMGGPFAGWLFDVSGSYDASFYVSGTVILVSGLMCLPLPTIARWEKEKGRRRNLE